MSQCPVGQQIEPAEMCRNFLLSAPFMEFPNAGTQDCSYSWKDPASDRGMFSATPSGVWEGCKLSSPVEFPSGFRLVCRVPGGVRDKELSCQCRRQDSWVGKIPGKRAWQPSPVFLPGKSHGQRSLVGDSLWGPKESDTTEWLHFKAFIKNKF